MPHEDDREFILLEKIGSRSNVLYEGSLEEVAEYSGEKAGILDYGDELDIWGERDE